MGEIITISDTLDEYNAAVALMPTRLMRYMLRANLDETDIIIQDRTLYLPLSSDSSVSLLESSFLTFFRCIDLTFSQPIDEITYWLSESTQYKFLKVFHPLYLAAKDIDCNKACVYLKCIHSQFVDYAQWFQEHSAMFNPNYVEGHRKGINRLPMYIEEMLALNAKGTNE